VATSMRGSNTFMKTSIFDSKAKMWAPKALASPDRVVYKVKDGYLDTIFDA